MTLHAGIGCTPVEAWNGENDEVMWENSPEGRYARKMKKSYRERFKQGHKVRVASRENLGTKAKTTRGRYVKAGEIVEEFEGDSYLVKGVDGRLVKKRIMI